MPTPTTALVTSGLLYDLLIDEVTLHKQVDSFPSF